MPSHPLILLLFFSLAFLPFLWLWIPGVLALAFRALGLSFRQGFALACSIFILSLALSFVNVVVKRVPRRMFRVVSELGYIYVFGLPFPVPRLRVVTGDEMLVTVNLGGAVMPMAAASIMAALMLLGPQGFLAGVSLLAASLIVALASYAFSRVVPGLGVAVPTLIPPTVSALSSLSFTLLLGVAYLAPPIAYAAAVYGTIVGADLANLAKCLRDLEASMISIGGAGTFDGIYLSGVVALLLTLLLTP